MRNQVEGTAIEIIGSHNMVAHSKYILQGIRHGRRTGSHRQTSHSPFESSDTRFENSLCRIGQTTINIPGITKAETVCRML